MRLPFPERIPLGPVAVFAFLLFILQTIEGTALYFSAGCVAFLLIATLAFNTAGGLTRASGAYVFFYSVLVVVIGISYKAFIGEPADSNLHDPRTTILVYVGGITAMLGAVVVSRRLARKTGIFENILKESEMYRSSIGCMVFGLGAPFLINLLGSGGAQLNSAFAQLNQLMPLGIVIGVMYEIRRSGGTRSMNLPVAVISIFLFVFYGILAFSKQGMLTPLYCWLIPACALRFRVSRLQIISSSLWVMLVFGLLVPYSQYGRRFVVNNPGLGVRFEIAQRLLGHPFQTRRDFFAEEEEVAAGPHYFNTGQGFWDRLQFIAVDDSLIDITDQGHVFGFSPIRATFINAVPHVFYPDKPTLNLGNLYAHEMGGLSEDDLSTGISFSPTAEAYHMGQWVGVFVAAPLVWLLLFVVFDSLFGDLRATPWGLLVIATISHVAPEVLLTGAIYLVTFGAAAFSFCAVFATWVAPIIAVTVLGRDRRRERQPSSGANMLPSTTN